MSLWEKLSRVRRPYPQAPARFRYSFSRTSNVLIPYSCRPRLVYWTDWGATPKIERVQMDGNNRRTIITGELGWPNGLVIDEQTLQLYWTDAKLDKIETSDLLVLSCEQTVY